MKLSRYRWVLWVVLLASIPPALFLGIRHYSRYRFECNWKQVSVGMSKDEVTRLLGEPNDVYRANQGWFFSFQHETWAWRPKRTLKYQSNFPYFAPAFLEGLFGPDSDDYVVTFTADGSVRSKAYPYHDRSP